MGAWRNTRPLTFLVVVGLLVAACGGRGIGGSNMVVTVKGTFTVTPGKVTPG